MRGARKRGAENDGGRGAAKREKVQDADDDEVGDVVGDEDDDIEEADDAELDNVVGEKELAKIEEAAGISAADTVCYPLFSVGNRLYMSPLCPTFSILTFIPPRTYLPNQK